MRNQLATWLGVQRFAVRALLLAALSIPALPDKPAQAVDLSAGDIIAIGTDTSAVPQVVRVDPVTGAQTVISSGGMLWSPQGVAIDKAGHIVVADRQNGIIRVDPVTGGQTLVSSGGLLSAPYGVAIEATGQLIVADPAGPSIVRVDPVTGTQTLLSEGPLLHGLTHVAVDASGGIATVSWFWDETTEEQWGRVVRVDPVTGAQTIVSESALIGAHAGVDFDDAGHLIAASVHDLLRVDPSTGVVTILSSGGLLALVLGVAVDGAARYIVVDWFTGIVRVDPVTGTQTLLSPGSGPLTLVWGVAVALPDLVATAVSDPPLVALLGDRFAVTDTVGNEGSVEAGASTTRYYLSLDTVKNTGDIPLVGARVVPALARGVTFSAAVWVEVDVRTPPSTYYLLVCADADKAVAERWDSNNCRASNGQVDVRAPDLVQVKVNSPPQAALVGGSFVAGDKVVNQGNLTAGTSSTQYYLSLDQTKDSGDRRLTGTRAIPALPPGVASEDTVPVTVPSVAAGAYYVIACADDTARVPESDENNCLASPGRVKIAGPDLVTASIGNTPATAAPGSTFPVTATVRNQGAVAAGASTSRYYLSVDTLRNGGDILLTGSRAVPGLARGAMSTGATMVGVPVNTPSASYYVLACADDALAVPETSETNNCRASEGRVTISANQ